MNGCESWNRRYSRALALAAAMTLVGCATAPPATEDGAIVLRAWEETIGGGGCKIGYDLIYPADMPEHVRVLRQRIGTEISPGVPEGALRDHGGPLTLPRPDRDPRVDRSDPETHVFPVTLMNFSSCQREILGEPAAATAAFIVGECAEGDCVPVRIELPEEPTRAVFRVDE
jgi:hypothetical protein